nr:aminotransferase class I/II-fold pyridoxal phosphate-dependent enzyme [Rhodoferax sp.]
MKQSPQVHGGPDGQGVPLHDFSTNSNACGPCPQTLVAVQACDASRYPDPAYTELKVQLADFHGVEPERIALAGSASEFIYRITAWVAQQGGQTVRVPLHAYGDYAQAARAWGVPVVTEGESALLWHADPSSPLGQSVEEVGLARERVLDCAYEPLRLTGNTVWPRAQRDALWQLYTPNKALGLTGVRAAYAIAPVGGAEAVAALRALCASWPVGAHGVALLQNWVLADTQAWLQGSLQILRGWKLRQIQLLQDAGWTVQPSETPFFCAQPPAGMDAAALCVQLRAHGIKLRDATSFGLPGWVRLGVLSPVGQDALLVAWVNSR